MTDPRFTFTETDRDTMRELTRDEVASLYMVLCCPFCKTPVEQFINGPRGGLAINKECPRCLARFNIIDRATVGRAYAWGQLIRRPVDGYTQWTP